jgi:hypothetical protein
MPRCLSSQSSSRGSRQKVPIGGTSFLVPQLFEERDFWKAARLRLMPDVLRFEPIASRAVSRGYHSDDFRRDGNRDSEIMGMETNRKKLVLSC